MMEYEAPTPKDATATYLKIHLIKALQFQLVRAGLTALECLPHTPYLFRRHPFLFIASFHNSSQRQIEHNAYFPVVLIWALQRVPSCLFSNMAGIKDDIAALL